MELLLDVEIKKTLDSICNILDSIENPPKSRFSNKAFLDQLFWYSKDLMITSKDFTYLNDHTKLKERYEKVLSKINK